MGMTCATVTDIANLDRNEIKKFNPLKPQHCTNLVLWEVANGKCEGVGKLIGSDKSGLVISAAISHNVPGLCSGWLVET